MAKKKRGRGVCRMDPSTVFGPVWVIGWLFTIGYYGMPFFWQGARVADLAVLFRSSPAITAGGQRGHLSSDR